MNQEKPLIQSLWIGDRLSVMEQICIASFLQQGHAFHLYSYDQVKGVPDGASIQDASTIIPASRIFKYPQHDSYAGFSNLFRYRLLMEKGGCWVDTDMVCLKPFCTDNDYVFASQRRKSHDSERPPIVTNCVIRSPVGSSLMEYCYDIADNKDPGQLRWGETGPELLHAAVNRFGLQDYVSAPEVFCPIDFWCCEDLLDVNFDHDRLNRCQAVHLWNEMWRRRNLNKSGSFVESCLYEQFKSLYL